MFRVFEILREWNNNISEILQKLLENCKRFKTVKWYILSFLRDLLRNFNSLTNVVNATKAFNILSRRNENFIKSFQNFDNISKHFKKLSKKWPF